MIKVPFIEYMENMKEYDKYSIRNITVRKYANNKPVYSFKMDKCPSTMYTLDDISYVIPTYVTAESSKQMIVDKYSPTPDTLVVEIDDITDSVQKSESNRISISKTNYINLDDYPITAKMHWFNVKVMEFYKYTFKTSICLATEKEKVRSYFKKITTPGNLPLNYTVLLKLFEYTAVTDKEFEKFMNKGE